MLRTHSSRSCVLVWRRCATSSLRNPAVDSPNPRVAVCIRPSAIERPPPFSCRDGGGRTNPNEHGPVQSGGRQRPCMPQSGPDELGATHREGNFEPPLGEQKPPFGG